MSKTSFSRKPRTGPKILKHRPLPHYELDARLFRILTLAALVGVALLPWLQAKNPTSAQSELRDGDDWGGTSWTVADRVVLLRQRRIADAGAKRTGSGFVVRG